MEETLKAKTVGDLMKALNKLDKSLPIVYSADAERNHFDYIYFDPCMGYMQGTKVVCI